MSSRSETDSPLSQTRLTLMASLQATNDEFNDNCDSVTRCKSYKTTENSRLEYTGHHVTVF